LGGEDGWLEELQMLKYYVKILNENLAIMCVEPMHVNTSD
jgi:hypothetical protein